MIADASASSQVSMSRKPRTARSRATSEVVGAAEVDMRSSCSKKSDRRSLYLMEPAVKKSRPYDSSRRVQASRTRQLRVAEVAGRLVVERGYAGMTMADVAVDAQVSVPWLYKVFGPKPLLVKHAYDVLLAGDADPVPLAQRPAFRALAAETDPRQVIERYAAISRDLISRVGPLAAALLSAVHSGDADLADLASTISHERLFGATTVTYHLAELGALAPGMAPRQ